MKVINLLNDIANNKPVPKKIKCFLHEGDNDIFTYIEEEKEYHNGYGYMRFPNHHLNDEVEIVEETKSKDIEELNKKHFHNRQRQLANKINELVRELNRLKGGKNE